MGEKAIWLDIALLCCIFTCLQLVKIWPHTHAIFSHIAFSPIKCDPLSENLALRANIEFEIEATLSVQVVSQLNIAPLCHGGLTLHHAELGCLARLL